MKRKLICVFVALMVILGTAVAQSATTDSITQWGITWYFNNAHEYGQFANGDYWVLGPVTIKRITPDYNGSSNGWEVNPQVDTKHGFSAKAKNGGFNPAKVPTLPYTSKAPIESVVKVISSGVAQPSVKTAAVLTIVDKIPPDNGKSVFRPPYTGVVKPLYRVQDLRVDLLPRLAPVGSSPSLSDVGRNFSYFRLEHVKSPAVRDLRPSDAMENYNPKNSITNHEALLRLMLNDGIEEKLPALIKFVQYGIDKCYAVMQGWIIAFGDGHDPGHRIVAAFAATMLDIEEAKSALMNATGFHEDYYLYIGLDGKRALYGESTSEDQYWNYILGLGGSRSIKDPYGYIDGGKCGEDYQLIVSQSWKGSILATLLMPDLKMAWNPEKWAVTADYVERWVSTGTWANPDPCAPFDGNSKNYGRTFGPDPSNPGQCIKDPDLAFFNSPKDFDCKGGKECGRFPVKNGANRDGGLYRSSFVASMWDSYRGKASSIPKPPVLRVTQPK